MRLSVTLTAAACLFAFAAQPAAAERVLPDFTALVDRAAPAVVNISTSKRVRTPQVPAQPPSGEEGPFNELFRRFFGEEGERGFDLEEHESEATGSGFILSTDGYVLTNYHVVRGADEIVVTLSDRRQLVAELVGRDAGSDLALLKVDAGGLPVVELGDSSGLRVGEWVLAIGSPFGFEHSVTAGIVSAKQRALRSERFVPFIQTDVAINPGNSGGPLFNLDGEVIGVNSQIYSRTGGFMGVSFAIPIEVAMDVVEQLRETGHVSRGWLGVNIQDVTRELALSFGLQKPEGALVTRVVPDSPAQRAGLEPGDVILEFDGVQVLRSSHLPQLVGGARAGRMVAMRVLREGRMLELEVAVDELPRPGARPSMRFDLPESPGPLGLAVEDLSEAQRNVHDLPDYGVLVTEVGEGPAYHSGFRSGDIILMIDQVRIRDAGHFAEAVGRLGEDRPVPVLVQRGGAPLFLALRVGDGG